MITLALLQPGKDLPVQQWTFDVAQNISIGRSSDNEVVLYSAVVSRKHLSIIKNPKGEWIVQSMGTNGTYIDGQPINQAVVYDGIIVRLASSGPQIQIHIQKDIHSLNRKISKMIDPALSTSSDTQFEDQFEEPENDNFQFAGNNLEKASFVVT